MTAFNMLDNGFAPLDECTAAETNGGLVDPVTGAIIVGVTIYWLTQGVDNFTKGFWDGYYAVQY